MTELVWVALISAGAALVTALLTQFLATRAASRSADRADKREALQWQRNETLRLEELARQDAQRRQELHDARLRELWGHVLVARWQMMDALERVPVRGRPDRKPGDVSAQALPTTAAAHAYAVALLGLASVRAQARDFHAATMHLQKALQFAGDDWDAAQKNMMSAAGVWNEAYKALEISVAALSDGLLDMGDIDRPL